MPLATALVDEPDLHCRELVGRLGRHCVYADIHQRWVGQCVGCSETCLSGLGGEAAPVERVIAGSGCDGPRKMSQVRAGQRVVFSPCVGSGWAASGKLYTGSRIWVGGKREAGHGQCRRGRGAAGRARWTVRQRCVGGVWWWWWERAKSCACGCDVCAPDC